jgi:DNA-binding SARP family transcriptional activator
VIRLRTLGTLDVTVDGAEAPPELQWKKNVALLLYLARAPTRRCTREHLIGLLWPDKDDTAARQSVREAIRVLRNYVGEDRLKTAGDQIQLLDGAVDLDTDQFDKLVMHQDWARATPLIGGEFARGFRIPGASAFEDWLMAERWHWRGRSMEALLRHAEERLAAGDLLGADEPTQRALQIDPLSEPAVRMLMHRLALAGDRSGALEVFDQFSHATRRDGSTTVEPETRALVARLQRARAWQLPKEAVSPMRSVAWRRAPLLGRERELATALAQWHQAREGHLALLVLEAESGGGKTRFAEELAARAALDGGIVVAMRAVPADVEHPASGTLSLARGGLLDAPGVAGAHPAALAALAEHASEWAERFPAKQPSSPWSLESGIAEVLRVTSAEQPLLLIFDDAQWIDSTSFAMIETLTRDLAHAPILLVLATTPEPAPRKLAELRARIGREVAGAAIPLGRLSGDALRALVQWALPTYAGEDGDRVSRRIGADSAGVPLLAVEICYAIAQGLDLEATNGAWPRPLHTLDQTFPGDLPDTIVAAIRVGFSCLTKPAQQALIAAAVLGERVTAGRIGRAIAMKGEALHAALDELEWRRWLVAEPRGYSFVARIVRDVVARDMVTEGQRQRILSAAPSATA